MTASPLTRSLPRADARDRALPIPRSWSEVSRSEVWFVVALVAGILAAMWVRHGGLTRDPLTGFGEVSALAGTYAALLGVLFASRAPWLDQVFGSDGLQGVHRLLGFLSVWAIAAHAVTSTVAFAGGSILGAIPEMISLVETVPGMLGAVIGMALFVLVAITSIRAARRRMSYESWHGVHVYAYLAVAFGFLHQLTVGADFIADPLANALWIALYVVAFGPLVLHRLVWPVLVTLRHRPRVLGVVQEASDVFSLYVGGRRLDGLAVRSGQFFIVRALTRPDWMHGHPFSISASPNGNWLRFTFKVFGDGTRRLAELEPGTPVLLEGPYGAMHGARRTGRRLLLVAGGIGIAPLRALAESFAFAPGDLDLVYRTSDPADVALRRELEALARDRGIRLHLIAGQRGTFGVGDDPLGSEALKRLVPDAAERDSYLCGPDGLMEHARRALLRIGAAPERIHLELFG